jgi:hypothetical protein
MHASDDNFTGRKNETLEAYISRISFYRFSFIFCILRNSLFEEHDSCKHFLSMHCKELVRFHIEGCRVWFDCCSKLISQMYLACNFASLIESYDVLLSEPWKREKYLCILHNSVFEEHCGCKHFPSRYCKEFVTYHIEHCRVWFWLLLQIDIS